MISNNVLTVYWACERSNWGASPVLVAPPTTPALKEMSGSKFSQHSLEQIKRCPSFRKYYHNCFCVKSPVGATIKANGDIISHGVDNDDELVRAFFSGSEDTVVFTDPRLLFFSEEPCDVTTIQASLSTGDVACKTQVISGVMDISQWYRIIHPAFVRPTNEDVTIRPDDTLMYLKFNTDKKIKFVEYTPTEELAYISRIMHSVKNHNSFMYKSIQNYYDAFKRRSMAKKILKEIKANIV